MSILAAFSGFFLPNNVTYYIHLFFCEQFPSGHDHSDAVLFFSACLTRFISSGYSIFGDTTLDVTQALHKLGCQCYIMKPD